MSKACDLSATLEGVRRRFERWRRTHRPRSRISDSLWAAAVRATGTCGIHRTAKVLGIDYYSLKKRVQQEAATAVGVSQGGAFIELTPAASASSCQ
jgi:hypothetical protein